MKLQQQFNSCSAFTYYTALEQEDTVMYITILLFFFFKKKKKKKPVRKFKLLSHQEYFCM